MAPALVLTQPAWPAGDAKAGKETARRWCAECHLVETRPGATAIDAAPPLAVIANDPTKTSSYLHAWLFKPRPPMPNLSLSQREIDDLVAYIESLRRR